MFGTTSFFQPKAPTVSVCADDDEVDVYALSPSHELSRQTDPSAAEALALTVVRVLSERFDLIDKLFSEYVVRPPDAEHQVSEWSSFRRGCLMNERCRLATGT